MRRGELYLVLRPGGADPRRQRAFVIVSRQELIDSRFSTVICASVYSRHDGLATQVKVGPEEGLKTPSSIHCDELVSLRKDRLTHYVGALDTPKLERLDRALEIAVGIGSPTASDADVGLH